MKLALIGYGRMGREIEKAALKKGHKIVLIIDKDNIKDLNSENLLDVDVALEFSQPESAADNILKCILSGVPVISGTTGWLNRLEEVKQKVIEHNGALLYASNFSIGVNTLFYINRKLIDVMKRIEGYKPLLRETHHIHKIDAPSGTALSLAQEIIDNTEWEGWVEGKRPSGNSFPIESIRENEVPGTHEIVWRSEQDELSIKHEAFSRTGFVNGALLAAEFVYGKKGVLSMSDLLGF